MLVIKRDGSKTEFDKSKIKVAILKAMKYGSGIYKEEIAEIISNEIEEEFATMKPTIYSIEKEVYNKLVQYGQGLTAKAYEGYRAVQAY